MEAGRGFSTGRYLTSGLEPVCKFSSCFYQMGSNLKNKRAVVCTVLNLQGKNKEKEVGEI